jgi:hypothetical protein
MPVAVSAGAKDQAKVPDMGQAIAIAPSNTRQNIDAEIEAIATSQGT